MIKPCPTGCDMQLDHIGGPSDRPHELWKCAVCGREEVRPCRDGRSPP